MKIIWPSPFRYLFPLQSFSQARLFLITTVSLLLFEVICAALLFGSIRELMYLVVVFGVVGGLIHLWSCLPITLVFCDDRTRALRRITAKLSTWKYKTENGITFLYDGKFPVYKESNFSLNDDGCGLALTGPMYLVLLMKSYLKAMNSERSDLGAT